MAHNNKLAQATMGSNTHHATACASFLDTTKQESNIQNSSAVSAILAQARLDANTNITSACASFFGMAVSATSTLHMVAMPTILAAAKLDSSTQWYHAAAPTLGLHRRPSEYPPRRRVGHHKSCGNTKTDANTHCRRVFPRSFLG